MLRYLNIQNLAVIETLEVEFEPGLNVLTGETGAGKSILVGAVGLLLGGRASSDAVRTGEDMAAVQAVFERPDGSELLIRREVTAQGRSRAFVNGVLTTAAAIKELGSDLVDLHGQHDHQALLDPATHLDLLDAFGALGELRALTAARHADLSRLVEHHRALRRESTDRERRLDLARYQVNEIAAITPLPGEDEDLQAQRRVLASAERLRLLCEESYAVLYERDTAVMAGLRQVFRRVDELAGIDPSFQAHLARRDEVTSVLDDLARTLRDYGQSIDASPERLQQVEDRLAALERLKRKYGPGLADVLAMRSRLAAEIASLESLDDQLASLNAELGAARGAYVEAAGRLSVERIAAARRLAERLVAELEELAMPGTRVEFRFAATAASTTDAAAGSERGLDEGELYVSPNPGEDLRALARIASGGEISRVMLALKSLATTDAAGKCLVFDEVDAGIGGRVANVVGCRLRRLGERFQVLCITHLPQIAARGGAHWVVDKHVRNHRTTTTLRRVHGADRLSEIARMIGGSTDTPGATAGARELIEQAKDEETAKAKVFTVGAKAKVSSREFRAPRS